MATQAYVAENDGWLPRAPAEWQIGLQSYVGVPKSSSPVVFLQRPIYRCPSINLQANEPWTGPDSGYSYGYNYYYRGSCKSI